LTSTFLSFPPLSLPRGQSPSPFQVFHFFPFSFSSRNAPRDVAPLTTHMTFTEAVFCFCPFFGWSFFPPLIHRVPYRRRYAVVHPFLYPCPRSVPHPGLHSRGWWPCATPPCFQSGSTQNPHESMPPLGPTIVVPPPKRFVFEY